MVWWIRPRVEGRDSLGSWAREGCPGLSLGGAEEPGQAYSGQGGGQAVCIPGREWRWSAKGTWRGALQAEGGGLGPGRRTLGAGAEGCSGCGRSLREQPGTKVWGRVGCPGPQRVVPPRRAEAGGPRSRPHL